MERRARRTGAGAGSGAPPAAGVSGTRRRNGGRRTGAPPPDAVPDAPPTTRAGRDRPGRRGTAPATALTTTATAAKTGARSERTTRQLPRQLPRQAIQKAGVPIRQVRKVVRPIDLTRRLLALLGPSTDGARQSLISLCLNSTTSLVAGAVLGSITGTFERLPGLLVLVPAAIGLRGNVFSSLGNRLSTAIHLGTFRLSFRRQTLVGQNIAASLVLTLM
ncbi:MAG: mgtE-like transporter, partial [Actinomycetota bacterium]|nr:mgtE-like transporter [Actinomycetota bacterium]